MLDDYTKSIVEQQMDNLIMKNYIDTPLGKCRMVKVSEIKDIENYIFYLVMRKFQLKEILNREELNALIDENDFVDLIKKIDIIYQPFKEMFQYFFDNENAFDMIENEKELIYYQDLIIKINAIGAKRKSKHAEMQRWQKMREFLQPKVTLEDIYTSVGMYRQDIDDMTLYKLNAYFNRISKFMNYYSSVLFATVTNKVKIEGWYESIGEIKKKKVSLTDLKKKEGKL